MILHRSSDWTKLDRINLLCHTRESFQNLAIDIRDLLQTRKRFVNTYDYIQLYDGELFESFCKIVLNL